MELQKKIELGIFSIGSKWAANNFWINRTIIITTVTIQYQHDNEKVGGMLMYQPLHFEKYVSRICDWSQPGKKHVWVRNFASSSHLHPISWL